MDLDLACEWHTAGGVVLQQQSNIGVARRPVSGESTDTVSCRGAAGASEAGADRQAITVAAQRLHVRACPLCRLSRLILQYTSTLHWVLPLERNRDGVTATSPLCRLHGLAHIELNAIDLALDTVARFSSLPLDKVGRPPPLCRRPVEQLKCTNGCMKQNLCFFALLTSYQDTLYAGCTLSTNGSRRSSIAVLQEFYSDFARIADDESRHFGWCTQRLRELGYEYGCMPAHDLLWQGALQSSGAAEVAVTVQARRTNHTFIYQNVVRLTWQSLSSMSDSLGQTYHHLVTVATRLTFGWHGHCYYGPSRSTQGNQVLSVSTLGADARLWMTVSPVES